MLGIISQLLYKTRSDLALVGTTVTGLTMACLVLVRGLTNGYINLAESLSWDFLWSSDGCEDIIIGSRYGDDIIGALVLRLERNGSGSGKKKAKNGKTGGKGVVRAWTTKMRYRGTGVGTELLEEAVRTTKEKLGRETEIGFAAEHANSKMVLPEVFNGGFRRREGRAAKALKNVVGKMSPGHRRSRSSF